MSSPALQRPPEVKPISHNGGPKPAPTEAESATAKKELRKWVYLLIACAVVALLSATLAFEIERDWGHVNVQFVRMMDPSGNTVAAKLFRPIAATAQNKMPGILNMHGYQNDKDTQDGFSIELARRGFVVLATDGIGHGDSTGAFAFGQFFGDPTYTMGTNTGFLYLKSLPFVDANALGVTGHSMGGINSFKIAGMNPDVKAIVSQDGGAGTAENHDVLFLYVTWPDMSGSTKPLVPVDPKAFGLDAPVKWDTTYGDFAAGTARRAPLVTSNHHLLTVQPKAIAEASAWFEQALRGGRSTSGLAPTDQVYMWKEIFGLIALLVTIFSLIPLTNILLSTRFFASVAQPMPNRYIPSRRTWWILATVNAVIGGLIYLFFTAPNYGPTILGALPFMRLNNMGNGITFWFILNAIVLAVLFFFWYRSTGKKAGVTMYDMGVSFDKEKTKFDWAILGKTLLLGAILFAWMYLLEGISQWALGEEFRFGWPYMRQFSNASRFGYFLIYLIPALAFFLLNGGIFLFGQARQNESRSPARTQLVWWLKILYAALMGLVLIWAIQYLPWIIWGTGPGFPQTVDPSWAIWPLMLWVYIPEFVVLLFMLTWFFRRTGRIYLGALMVASLAIWFLAAGTVIGL